MRRSVEFQCLKRDLGEPLDLAAHAEQCRNATFQLLVSSSPALHCDVLLRLQFVPHSLEDIHNGAELLRKLRRSYIVVHRLHLLAFAGFAVTREYYVNDAGAQVDALARSAYLRYREALGEAIGEIPPGLYPGDYLKPVGETLAAQHGKELLAMPESQWLPISRAAALTAMLAMIENVWIDQNGSGGIAGALSDGSIIRGCRISRNGGTAIGLAGGNASPGSIITDNVIYGNDGVGIQVNSAVIRGNNIRSNSGLALQIAYIDSSSGFGDNVINGNNGGNANAQTSGGHQIGTNVCGDKLTCP